MYKVYATSVDDGNLTSTCMRVVAFLPLLHPPLVANGCARAQSASTRLSGNDLSHTRNLDGPECTEQERERKSAILDDESSIPGTYHVAQVISSVGFCDIFEQYLQTLVKE